MENQMTLFAEISHAPLACVGIRTVLDAYGVDKSEAPDGFYAELKVWKGYNICRDCESRKLCQENKDDWCMKNRCMESEVITNAGRIIKRKDGKSVIFKRL